MMFFLYSNVDLKARCGISNNKTTNCYDIAKTEFEIDTRNSTFSIYGTLDRGDSCCYLFTVQK